MKAAEVHGARAEFCCRSGAVGAMKAAEVHGARAEFCCRSGAVGAMKAAEVHGARAEFCCRSRYMARGPNFVAVVGTWREGRVLLPGPNDWRGGQGITACLQGGDRQGCRRLGRDQQRVSLRVQSNTARVSLRELDVSAFPQTLADSGGGVLDPNPPPAAYWGRRRRTSERAELRPFTRATVRACCSRISSYARCWRSRARSQ